MAQDSEADSFTEFVRARSLALYRYAYLLVGDRGLADDLLQEALAKTFAAWRRVDGDTAEAYVRRVITTTAVSWWRRKAWQLERPHSELPDDPYPGHGDDVATRSWMWQELHRLPPRQRAAVVLRYYEDLSEAQTADILGCSVGTVKSQVSAGLKRLGRNLGPAGSPRSGSREVGIER
jgi:RNA polymerase sigma-70 factor (sigma-E family)